ncbi:MAG: 30S ribosomal protein S21 [Planctomycetota bacterium]
MIRVQVRPNEALEAALRRFKRQCNYAGIFRLAKKYAYFEKRSDKRRREDRERIRAIQRALRKQTRKTKPKTLKRSKVRAGQGGDNGENKDENKTAPQTAGATDAAAAVKAPETAVAATTPPRNEPVGVQVPGTGDRPGAEAAQA